MGKTTGVLLALILALCCASRVQGQSITFDNGVIAQDIYGNGNPITGFAPTQNTATSLVNDANNNQLTIGNDTSSASSGRGVYGGAVQAGAATPLTANGNTVIITNTTIDPGSVYGGYVWNTGTGDATTTGNSVTLTNYTADNGAVYGGNSQVDSGTATATNNSVVFNSGSANGNGNIFGGNAQVDNGGTGNATATGNSVTINGGTIAMSVAGGQSMTISGTPTTSNNTVTINGGTLNNEVFGGWSESTTAGPSTVISTGNTVVVNGGTLNNAVFGGASVDFGSGQGTASGNNVFIYGGTIYSAVIGGLAESLGGGNDTAINNTVTISNSPTFGPSAILLGGDDSRAGTIAPTGALDILSGNTLNVLNYTGKSSVAEVANFQHFNFLLPAGFGAGDTALGVTTTLALGSGATASTVDSINFLSGARTLQAGDSIILLGTTTNLVSGTLANNGQTISAKYGAALLYDLQVEQLSNAVIAKLVGAQAAPGMNAFPASFLAGMTLLNQGADLVAGQGMNDAVDAAVRASLETGYGLGIFGTISGGWSRYNTGSHVDMSSFSLMTGLSYGAALKPGHLTVGAFFEYANGSYDTYNSFSNAASVHGDGDTRYMGAGLIGRMDFKDTGPGHVYVEASGRTGGVRNKYNTNDLTDAIGRHTGTHETYSAYYGLHGAAGYIWKVMDKGFLDMYGKYFWSRQEGDSITLSTGDPVKFEDVDSSRLRLGSRFTYVVNEYFSPYVGAAWEHEFDGQARASTYGYDIKTPSLRGDTGIGELGFILKPSPKLPLTFNMAVQGYAGKREGVMGSLQAKFEF